MATFDGHIWNVIYHLKKKIFIYLPRDIKSSQKSTTKKGGIVVSLIADTAPMVLIPKLQFNFGIVFV